jgi:orotate phosphoribosyltransferase
MPEATTALRVAESLLQIKAIQLQPQNPFRWSSGLLAPIYCDNRKILGYPEVRTFITRQFVSHLQQNFELSTINCIAGVATSGIPFATLVAHQLELPMVYVRPEPKEHGMGQQIEGRRTDKKSVFVIEDLISTAQSSIKVIEALRENDYQVQGLGAIFTYQFDQAEKNLQASDCPYFTLSHYEALVEQGVNSQYIGESMIESLKAWRQAPEEWSQKHAS